MRWKDRLVCFHDHWSGYHSSVYCSVLCYLNKRSLISTTGESYGQSALVTDSRILQPFVSCAAALQPLIHHKASLSAPYPAVEIFDHVVCFNHSVVAKPSLQIDIQLLNNLRQRDSQSSTDYLLLQEFSSPEFSCNYINLVDHLDKAFREKRDVSFFC
jgi:hypothetical protein